MATIEVPGSALEEGTAQLAGELGATKALAADEHAESEELLTLGRLLGAGSLGVLSAGARSPLAPLLEESHQHGLAVLLWQHHLVIYSRFGDDLSRREALTATASLLGALADAKSLSGAERFEAAQYIFARWQVLTSAAVTPAEEQAAVEAVDRAVRSAMKNVTRQAARTGARSVEQVQNDLVSKTLELASALRDSPGHPLNQFLAEVPHQDFEAWRQIAEDVRGRLTKLRPGLPPRALQGHVSALKGLLQELSFFRGARWRKIRRLISKGARDRAAYLSTLTGEAFRPVLVEEALFEARVDPLNVKSVAFYDGAMFVGRPLDASHIPPGAFPSGVPAEVMEVYPHATAQVKAEKQLSIDRQLQSDIRREHPPMLILHTRDGSRGFILRTVPLDGHATIRVMGLPHLPLAEIIAPTREVEDAIRAATAPLPSNGRPRRAPAPMPGGIPKLFAPTRFDATQAGALATLMLQLFIP